MRSGLRATVFVAAGIGAALLRPAPDAAARAATFPSDDAAIVHVLNRIGYGPRPGDVETVRRVGLQRYIEQQLRPERIGDGAVEARLAPLSTLAMRPREIADRFERPLEEARRARQQANAPNGASPENAANPVPPMLQQQANLPLIELSEQKILRAAYSERQLEEVLTDFWFNHFNVDARKGVDRFFLTEYERDVIRPHVLGKFRDLLGATAKSPAMLFYLDNWQSVDPNGPHPNRQQFRRGAFGGRGRGRFVLPAPPRQNPAQAQNVKRGLNENYGRELMELHTLGVDGGYTQHDVTEVARAFTGWTIDQPRQGGGFKFEPRLHDDGKKTVLGHTIGAGGGERDGEQVLDILARHPSTARFIVTKLVRRFVSDTPPSALVDRAAATFRSTDGDLREVMRTILTSPEFLGVEAYRAKTKTPFEFIASMVRATGAEVQDALPLVRQLQQLGMPLYQCQPPTGYKDTADAWVNTGALVSRMNIAVQLSAGRLPGTSIDPRLLDGATPQRTVDAILNGNVSDATRATIARAAEPQQMIALTLGSPEFQRR